MTFIDPEDSMFVALAAAGPSKCLLRFPATAASSDLCPRCSGRVSEHSGDAHPAPGITVRNKGRFIDVYVGGWRAGSYVTALGVRNAIERNREYGAECAARHAARVA